MTEKILSRASGRDVRVGDFLWAKVHTVSLPDLTGFFDFEFIERNGLRVWDPERVLICMDHFMYPSHGLGVAGISKLRAWAKRQGIPARNLFDIGRHGLSHQVPAEAGMAIPGTVYVAADTQASTAGALNCFALASLEATPYVLATGETWLKIPPVIRIHLTGTLRPGVLSRDICLKLMDDLQGRAVGKVIEFSGPGIANLSMDLRMGVANGANHLGAITMVFPADKVVTDYLAKRARYPYEAVQADDDAAYGSVLEYDLGDFEPMVAGPDNPHCIQPLGKLSGVPITAAYIGSCASGRLDDLAAAATVLHGRKVSSDVRLVVTPISSEVMQQASAAGYITTLTEAGATVTTPGCGACFHGNTSPLYLDDEEVCVTTSVENWPGRMGSHKAHIYIANAAVVSEAAVRGRLGEGA